jgi:hypothetical protein
MANSMLKGSAKAIGVAFLESADPDAAVVLVSADNPLPVTGGGGGGGDATAANQVLQIAEATDTNTMLDSVIYTDATYPANKFAMVGGITLSGGSDAVTVEGGAMYVQVQGATSALPTIEIGPNSGSVSAFTSTTPVTFAGQERFVHVPATETASLLLMFGTGSVLSSALYSYRIDPGGSFELSSRYSFMSIQMMLTSAGTAFITDLV